MKKEPVVIASLCGVFLLLMLAAVGAGGYYAVKYFGDAEKEKQRQEAMREEKRLADKKANAANQSVASRPDPSKPDHVRRPRQIQPPDKPPVATLVREETRGESEAKRAEPMFKEAHDLLKDKEYHKSIDVFNRARAKMQYVSNDVIDNEPASKWLKPRVDGYVAAVVAIAKRWQDRLSKEDPELTEACQFVSAIGRLKDVRELYLAMHDQIVRHLQAYGKNVVLVSVGYSKEEYKGILTSVFADKFPKGHSPLKLHFRRDFEGYSVNATKTVSVSIKEKTVKYKVGSRDFSLPEGAIVMFNTFGNRQVKTSWDKIETIVAVADVPKTVTGTDHSALQTEFRKRVADAVRKKFAELPVFTLFPGVDVSKVALMTSSKINKDNATILAYKAPELLKKQIADHLKRSGVPTRQRVELAKLIVKYDLEDLRETLLELIKNTVDREISPLVYDVSQKPGFGDYQVSLAILRKTNNRNLISNLSAAAQSRPKLAKAIEAIILDKQNTYRAAHVGSYLQALPKKDRAAYESWLTDADPVFIKQVVNLLCHDAPTTQALILKHYGKLGTDARVAMWSKVATYRLYVDKTYAPELFDLNKAACIDTNAAVAKGAISAMSANARSKGVWRALADLRDKMPQDTLSQAESVLIKTCSRVDRGLAVTVLADILKDNQKTLYAQFKSDPVKYRLVIHSGPRRYTIDKLLELNKDDSTAAFKLFRSIQKTTPGDYGYDYAVTLALTNHERRMKYDFSSTDLKEFLDAALATKETNSHRFCHRILGAGLRGSKDPYYRRKLEAILATEKSSSNKSYIKRLLSQ